MKFLKNLSLLILFTTLLSGCKDRDKPFYGDWRENLGSGKITLKKNKQLNYFGKQGTWEAKWNHKSSCLWCPKAGSLILNIQGKKTELSFSFTSAQLGKDDEDQLSLKGSDGKILHFTRNSLSKSTYPSNLPAGWLSESNGLNKYAVITDMAFSDTTTFAIVDHPYGAHKSYSELFKKDAGKWSKVKVANFKPNPSSSIEYKNIFAQGKKVIVTSSSSQIFFSNDEGKNFAEIPNTIQFPHAKTEVLVFKGDLYLARIGARGQGENWTQFLELNKMTSFTNQNRSSWKKVLDYNVRNGELDLASNGAEIIVSAEKVYKSFDGDNWTENTPSQFSAPDQSYHLKLSSKDDLVFGYYDNNVYLLSANGVWQKKYTIYSSKNMSTDGTYIYFNDWNSGEGFYLSPGSALSSKKKYADFVHSGRFFFKSFSGNGNYYAASDQGLFSKTW